MKKTIINGKAAEQVMQELLTPFDEQDFKRTPDEVYDYLPISVLENRWNQVVGFFNYDKEVSQPIVAYVNEKPKIFVTMKVTLKDDDGNTVAVKSASGCSSVIIVKSTGNDKNIKSDVAIAESDAFKHCLKGFGVGLAQLRQRNGKSTGQTGAQQRGQQQTGQKTSGGYATSDVSDIVNADIQLTSCFKSYKSYLKADGVDASGEVVSVVIWHDDFDTFGGAYGTNRQEAQDNFIKRNPQGTVMHGIRGVYQTYNCKGRAERQFVFKPQQAA